MRKQTPPLDKLETVFKALGDSTRLRILALLAGGEVCVCHIHDTIRVPQPTVSRHLAYLRRAGLVDTRRRGTWIHYQMSVRWIRWCKVLSTLPSTRLRMYP